MKVYPVGHGNHDNMYFIAKEKDLFTMKIMVNMSNEEAHVLKCSVPKQNFKQFLNVDVIYEALQEKISKWDFKIMTPKSEILKGRSTIEIEQLREKLYV